MLSLLRNFSHWKSSTSKFRKLRFNPHFNLKADPNLPPRHDFINFKEFTGNEILFTLKDSHVLRPSELSCALLELGVRDGAPEEINWNSHETVQFAVAHIKTIVGQLPCKVLTSIAHAANRLQLSDAELWAGLERHILRTLHKLEPKGLSYCFDAFVSHGSEEFYERLIAVAPIYVKFLNGRDLLNVVRGCMKRGITAEPFFAKWIYPLVVAKKKMCSPMQLEEFKALFEQKSDCPEEVIKNIEEAIEYKWNRRRELAFGAGT